MTPEQMSPENVLRRALEHEAARVEISPDALDEIRARTSRRSWLAAWRVPLAGTAVAALAGGVTATVLVAGPAGPPPDLSPNPSPPAVTTPTVPTPAVSEPAPPAPPPTSAPPGLGSTGLVAILPVYYVGPDRLTTEAGERVERPRLYREFAHLDALDRSPAAMTRAAVDAMFRRPPADPDYASAWPAQARVRSTRIDGDTVTVDLAGAGDAVGRTLPAERARVAVQQLVWTATAASGAPAVRLLLDGRPAGTLFGHVPGGGALRRAPLIEVVAPVWLIEPQDGGSALRQLTVHVAGSVFEATVRLQVRRGSSTGTVVVDRTITLDAGRPPRVRRRSR
jgi:hypothetical protein